jgi:hypothetical protein
VVLDYSSIFVPLIAGKGKEALQTTFSREDPPIALI